MYAIVARFKIKDGTHDQVLGAFREHIAPALKGEHGFVRNSVAYDADRCTLHIFQEWETKEDADAHASGPEEAERLSHIAEYFNGEPEMAVCGVSSVLTPRG
jgi:quinol monooxygenase YgiN